jgi:hypothetical protein
LVRGQAAQAVVAAELYDYDRRVQEQDGADTGYRILGGCAAGALIYYLVVVAAAVQIPLQSVREGLAALEAVAGGDAVSIADQYRTIGGFERARNYQQAD